MKRFTIIILMFLMAASTMAAWQEPLGYGDIIQTVEDTGGNRIRFFRYDGTTGEWQDDTGLTSGAGVNPTLGVMVQPATGDVIWARDDGEVRFFRFDTSTNGSWPYVQSVIPGKGTGAWTNYGMVLQPTTGDVIWAREGEAGRVRFQRFDATTLLGTQDTMATNPGNGNTHGMAVLPNGDIVWTREETGINRIRMFRFDALTLLMTQDVTLPIGINPESLGLTVDVNGDIIYGVRQSDDKIRFWRLDGTSFAEIGASVPGQYLTGGNVSVGLTVDPATNDVMWGLNDVSINRFRLYRFDATTLNYDSNVIPGHGAWPAVGMMTWIRSSCQDMIDAGQGNIADLNEDCYVNFADFTILAKDWMRCNVPTDPNCEITW